MMAMSSTLHPLKKALHLMMQGFFVVDVGIFQMFKQTRYTITP
jgi:hypothetical protein